MVKNLYKKYLSLCIIICLTAALLCGCHTKEDSAISKTGFYFDTVIQIVIYRDTDDGLLDRCFQYCEEFENRVSRTVKDSEISQINEAGGEPVEVSDDTIKLLEQGILYGDLSGGVFDVTVAPLSTLWNFKDYTGDIPDKESITEALSHVNYKNIMIDGNTVRLKDPEAAIDMGGIAKGYMADRLKEFLLSEGVERGMINLGGNVLTIGKKEDGGNWNIGIRKPFADKQEVIMSVSVGDQSVVTSGSYERYFKTEDGRIWHHILDTKTGYPCDNELYSVTILSDSSVEGDALSTTCFALGLKKGMELIGRTDGVEAIFITQDYKIVDTRK